MAATLTDSQRQDIESAFKLFDKNGDGLISAEELGEALKQAGQEVTDDELRTMIRAADANGNGKIEYKEFEQMMAAQFGAQITTEDIEFYFKKFDKNGDGFISADEMKLVIVTFHGTNLSPEQYDKEVDSMIKAADINNDGKISFEEFEKVIRNSIN